MIDTFHFIDNLTTCEQFMNSMSISLLLDLQLVEYRLARRLEWASKTPFPEVSSKLDLPGIPRQLEKETFPIETRDDM